MVGLILLVSAVELLLAGLILRRMTWLQRVASAFLLDGDYRLEGDSDEPAGP